MSGWNKPVTLSEGLKTIGDGFLADNAFFTPFRIA
jgi:hypothetical protein